MIPTNRITTHPGVFVRENLEGIGATQIDLAAHTGMSVQRINQLVNGKRGITAETAWLLAQAFRTTPEFWMNLQAMHDLTRARPAKSLAPLKRKAA